MQTGKNLTDYPDVLGMITNSARLNIEALQCALSIYPPASAVGQPFEVLLLLQNACDKPIPVEITLGLPHKDSSGKRINLRLDKDKIGLQLQPAEVGLLHLPILVETPTQPSEKNLITVRLETRTPKGCSRIRPVQLGRPALSLKISPYRLKVLREVGFSSTTTQAGLLQATFNVIAGEIQVPNVSLSARYETLWSIPDFAQEQAQYAALSQQAYRFTNTLTRTSIMKPLMALTERNFRQAGLPLLQGEALYITKTLTYALEEGFELEQGFGLEKARWFDGLIRALHDKTTADVSIEDLLEDLYPAIMYDAVQLGVSIVEKTSHQSLKIPGAFSLWGACHSSAAKESAA